MIKKNENSVYERMICAGPDPGPRRMERSSIYQGLKWEPGHEVVLATVVDGPREYRLVRRLWGLYVELWQGGTRRFCKSAMLAFRDAGPAAEVLKYLRSVFEQFEREGLPERSIQSAGDKKA